MEGIITYRRKEKKGKVRTITTYSKTIEGRALKKRHIGIKDEIYSIFEERKTCYTYAYQKNSNTKEMVKQHIDSNYFLKLDIYSFFDSISQKKLIEKISNNKINDNIMSVIQECFCAKERGIAIGLIPSPILANVYLAEFDKRLGEKLLEYGDLIYTRYADDIVISAKIEFDTDNIIEIIKFLLFKEELFLNDSKIQKVKFTNIGDHIKITGLNIIHGKDSNYITVSRQFKKEVKIDKNSRRKKSKKGYIKYNEYRDNRG